MRKTATTTVPAHPHTTVPVRPQVPGQLALFDDCCLCAAPVALGDGARWGAELLCRVCADAQDADR